MNADELLSTSLTKAVSNRLYAGLAVGHPGTHTALVLVEYVPVTDSYYLCQLRRTLDKSHTELVAGLISLFSHRNYSNVSLAVDRTVAGAPFMEYLRRELPPMAAIVGVNITGGVAVTGMSSEPMTVNLPKLQLIQTGKLVLDRLRLKNLVAFKEDGQRLQSELAAFQVRPGTHADGVYAGDQRQGVFDDTVFGLCLALWLGENSTPPDTSGPMAYTSQNIRAAERAGWGEAMRPTDRWGALRDLGYGADGSHPQDDDGLFG
jgi:hypothetical protein